MIPEDFEGEPRVQRSATDVGADELPPIGPTYPHFVPVGNFATPIYLTGPPNDPHRVFVVERGGTIRIIKDGTVEPTPFLDISSLVTTVGEGGLLSMAFAPDYATSRRFYVYYAGVPDSSDGGLQGDIHVAEFQARPTTPTRPTRTAAASCCTSTTRRANRTTEGSSSPAPTGCSGSRPATATSTRASPRTGRHSWASCCGSTRIRAARRRTPSPPTTRTRTAGATSAPRSGRTACAIRIAGALTARRATSSSPTSARAISTRSTTSPPGIRGESTSAGRSPRATWSRRRASG